ncbi:adhesion G-protein coupled receptor G6 isoform X9 [Mugil cephalus]|uniref:adhesion G-protein coupled receptor G6 isoform X9 n=1 Tax=Mugil cephalus TaxID=48193 RepID=UPI001FB66B7B|nr:adhesion G-protein coupled receptor G6 isoform X9 [Mugil cephalus]
MESCTGGGGGRWRLRLVVPVVLLWMSLHRHVLGCSSTNCYLVLTEAQGEITSPCYPQKYPNSQTCKWIMQAPAGFIIQLSFLDFDLEEAQGCIYDKVVVNTGNTDVKFCGLTANGLTLNSTGNVMELSFTSDFSVQKRGFSVSFRHVAVALRNQKVRVKNGNGQITEVSNSVSIPSLSEFTLCFEVERSSQKQTEWLFTYYDSNNSNNVGLRLGSDSTGMKIIIDTVQCSVSSVISSSDITSSMKPFCVLWTSSNGLVSFYFNGRYRAQTCSSSSGHSVPAGGVFQLGGEDSFVGNMYNLRLWNYEMTPDQLETLTCDKVGNVIDWDNSHWSIPSTLAQTDTSLSCICYPHCIHLTTAAPTSGVSPPSNTPLTTTCDPPGTGCPEGVFYRIDVEVEDAGSTLTMEDVEEAVALWLNQTFQDWNHNVSVGNISIRALSPYGVDPTRYACQALLVHYYVTNESVGEAAVSTQLSTKEGHLSAGLRVQSASVKAQLIENCPEENPLHYLWPESRPSTTQYLPCFPNKDQSASRTCLISKQNYSSYWSAADFRNCTDIDTIHVSAENAAEVAGQLAVITNNELSNEEVSKVVTKVKQLVDVAKINSSLASTVVTIISNVMTSSETALAASSEKALKTVDELVQKIEFEGQSISITSRHLALGISALNTTVFNGTSFSAFISPNTTDPQIDFESERVNPLAQVLLPASLLSGDSLSEDDRLSLSRINFMFFSKTNLFQREQDGRSLNSYVVASSVGNLSISNLKDPVKIEIAHLPGQPSLNPACMFWNFTMNDGAGGWSSKGCRVSEESTNNKTICLCDHLTHFGILMDISGVSPHIDPKNNKILTFITYIGCGISAIFSAATLLTYIAFEKLRRDYPSKILMNLSTSLLFLNMVFLLDGWLASLDTHWLCLSVAILLHYFLLTSFTWMGLESIHMYIALVKVFNTYIRRYILKFCIVGWGLPAVLVGIIVAVDKNSYGLQEYGQAESADGSSEVCWIQNPVVFYTTCVGYFCLVFLLNVAMFIVVMMQICGRNGKRSNRTLREEVLRNLRSVISLTFLLGMTWGFALFAWGPVSLAFMYLFTIFNSLQGLFIFIFHCALKENVQKQWRRYLCCGRFRLSDNSDWSKTATNNTKKVSSDNLGKSLSSSSFGSSTANWTSQAKATLNPFTKRHSNTDKCYSNQTGPKCVSSSSSSSEVDPNSSSSTSSILPVSQMIDKVKGYCSTRTDNFYKNIILSDSFAHSTRF